jgi:hypothetical protein
MGILRGIHSLIPVIEGHSIERGRMYIEKRKERKGSVWGRTSRQIGGGGGGSNRKDCCSSHLVVFAYGGHLSEG